MGTNQNDKLLHSKGNQKENLQKWEKIVSNDATDKGLISKICKQQQQQKPSPHMEDPRIEMESELGSELRLQPTPQLTGSKIEPIS